MLLGRARYSLSLVVPQNVSLPVQPQPLLACAAAYLKWRVSPVAQTLQDYEDVASALAKVNDHSFVERFDEQTIAITNLMITRFAIVADINQSNVDVLAENVCVLAAPQLFEPSSDRTQIVERIVGVISEYDGCFLPGITTLEALEGGERRPSREDFV